MNIKTTIKIIVDIVMTVLFFVMMAYHLIGQHLHEWFGASLFVLFILHNILNWKWYRGLFKGKYTVGRIFHTIINFLLLAAMLGMMISGIMLSREVFGFLNIRAGMFGRRLHMICGAWAFILMSAHLGLHWGMMLGMLKKFPVKWAGSKPSSIIFRIIVFLLAAYGIYAFVIRQLGHRMFLLIEYAFFDFDEPAIFFFADYIAILTLFAAIAYYSAKLMRKTKTGVPYENKRNERTDRLVD